jgi:hypothetical protein
VDKAVKAGAIAPEKGRAVFRVVIAGSQQAIFE